MSDPAADRTSRQPDKVANRVRDARDSLPGERDALPPGSLPATNQEPHGDEHREPVKLPTPPP
jgi:hypothetical protein